MAKRRSFNKIDWSKYTEQPINQTDTDTLTLHDELDSGIDVNDTDSLDNIISQGFDEVGKVKTGEKAVSPVSRGEGEKILNLTPTTAEDSLKLLSDMFIEKPETTKQPEQPLPQEPIKKIDPADALIESVVKQRDEASAKIKQSESAIKTLDEKLDQLESIAKSAQSTEQKNKAINEYNSLLSVRNQHFNEYKSLIENFDKVGSKELDEYYKIYPLQKPGLLPPGVLEHSARGLEGVEFKPEPRPIDENMTEGLIKIESAIGNLIDLGYKVGTFGLIDPKFRETKLFKKIKGTPLDRLVGSFQQGAGAIPAGLFAAGEYVGKEIGSESLENFSKRERKNIEDYIQKIAPVDPNYAEQLSSGIGSMLVFLPFGMFVGTAARLMGAGPKLANFFGMSGATFLESATEAGHVFTESGDPEAAEKTFLANMLVIGITNKFGVFADRVPGLKKMFLAAPLEALQEASQEVIAAKAQGEEPDWDEVLTAASIGGIIGGGASFVDTTPYRGRDITRKKFKQVGDPNTPRVLDRVEKNLEKQAVKNLKKRGVELSRKNIETEKDKLFSELDENERKLIQEIDDYTLRGKGLDEAVLEELSPKAAQIKMTPEKIQDELFGKSKKEQTEIAPEEFLQSILPFEPAGGAPKVPILEQLKERKGKAADKAVVEVRSSPEADKTKFTPPTEVKKSTDVSKSYKDLPSVEEMLEMTVNDIDDFSINRNAELNEKMDEVDSRIKEQESLLEKLKGKRDKQARNSRKKINSEIESLRNEKRAIKDEYTESSLVNSLDLRDNIVQKVKTEIEGLSEDEYFEIADDVLLSLDPRLGTGESTLNDIIDDTIEKYSETKTKDTIKAEDIETPAESVEEKAEESAVEDEPRKELDSMEITPGSLVSETKSFIEDSYSEFRTVEGELEGKLRDVNSQLSNVKGRDKNTQEKRKNLRAEAEEIAKQLDEAEGKARVEYEKRAKVLEKVIDAEIEKLNIEEDLREVLKENVLEDVFERPGIEWSWQLPLSEVVREDYEYLLKDKGQRIKDKGEKSTKREIEKFDKEDRFEFNNKVFEVEKTFPDGSLTAYEIIGGKRSLTGESWRPESLLEVKKITKPEQTIPERTDDIQPAEDLKDSDINSYRKHNDVFRLPDDPKKQTSFYKANRSQSNVLLKKAIRKFNNLTSEGTKEKDFNQKLKRTVDEISRLKGKIKKLDELIEQPSKTSLAKSGKPGEQKTEEPLPQEILDKLTYQRSGNDMYVVLPSGRRILAPNTTSKKKALEIAIPLLKQRMEEGLFEAKQSEPSSVKTETKPEEQELDSADKKFIDAVSSVSGNRDGAVKLQKNLKESIENKDLEKLSPATNKGWLHYGNKNAKKYFEDVTGVKLPSTDKGTIEALNNWADESKKKPQVNRIIPQAVKEPSEKTEKQPYEMTDEEIEQFIDDYPTSYKGAFQRSRKIAKNVMKEMPKAAIREASLLAEAQGMESNLENLTSYLSGSMLREGASAEKYLLNAIDWANKRIRDIENQMDSKDKKGKEYGKKLIEEEKKNISQLADDLIKLNKLRAFLSGRKPQVHRIIPTEEGGVEFKEVKKPVRESPRTKATGLITGGAVDRLEKAGYEWVEGELKKDSPEYWEIVGKVGSGKVDRLIGKNVTIRKKDVGKIKDLQKSEKSVSLHKEGLRDDNRTRDSELDKAGRGKVPDGTSEPSGVLSDTDTGKRIGEGKRGSSEETTGSLRDIQSDIEQRSGTSELPTAADRMGGQRTVEDDAGDISESSEQSLVSESDETRTRNLDLKEKEPVRLSKSERKRINSQVKDILENKKPSELTEKDKEILRQYTGEGGLTPGSIEALNQHYTDYPVINAIFNAIDKSGFKYSTPLEPAVGSGNFVGFRPNKKWTTIDVDPINHKVVQYLYPDATHYNISFEKYKGEGHDLIISNVPFLEKRGNESFDVRPDVKSLHDFYFVNAVDIAPPNGLIVFITSKGTMDKVDKKIREEIISKADLVTAFRLPGGTFEKNTHTSVITDIIVLQKRFDNSESRVPQNNEMFVNSARLKVEDGKFVLDENEGINTNLWYYNHPESILGTPVMGVNKLYGGKLNINVEGDADLSKIGFKYKPYIASEGAVVKSQFTATEKIPDKLAQFQEWARQNGTNYRLDTQPNFRENIVIKSSGAKTEIWVRDYIQEFKDVEVVAKTYKQLPTESADAQKITGLNNLKLIADQVQKEKKFNYGKQIEAIIGEYKSRFNLHPKKDRSLKKLFNQFNEESKYLELISFFDENWQPEAVFTQQTRFEKSGEIKITDKSTLVEKALFNENIHGEIDLTKSKFLDISNRDELLKKGYSYVSKNKVQNDILYYSGNIYNKIELAAENLAALDPKPENEFLIGKLNEQLERLEELKPEPKTIEDIDFRGNEKWLKSFRSELFPRFREYTDNRSNRVLYESGYGDIYDNYLNNNQLVSLQEKDRDGNTVTLPEQEIKARIREAEERIHAVKEEIKNKIKGNPELLEKMQWEYNKRYRNYVKPDYTKAAYVIEDVLNELPTKTIDGKPFSLRKNQIDWIVKALYEGKGINAHDVGGGKTFAAITLARVLKKRGIAKKPIFSVPAKTIIKWERDIKFLFPDAKVLNLGNLPKNKRKELLYKAANNEYDYVLISHEGFSQLKLPLDKELEYFNQVIRENIVDEEKSGRAKALEMMKIEKFRQVIKRTERDPNLTFDKLGFDSIVVDEAHAYKNIGVSSELVSKGAGTPFGINVAIKKKGKNLSDLDKVDVNELNVSMKSARSYDFRFKSQFITEKNNGKNVFMLTATPTPNKPMEIFTMLRHLDVEILDEYGIQTDRDFANQFLKFGSVVNPNKKRNFDNIITAVVNAQELRTILDRYVDKLAMEQMPWIKLPEANVITHYFKASESAKSIYEDLKKRIGNLSSSWKRQVGEDTMLGVYSTGRSGAIDPRLYESVHAGVQIFHRDMNSETDKIEKAVKIAEDVYKKNKRAGQLIFLDNAGHSTAKLDKNLHQEIKDELVNRGIKRTEVAIISGQQITNPNTGKERQLSGDALNKAKQEIVDRYNEGKIRFIIGTSQSAGEGMDIQVKTTDIYMLDIPYTPKEFIQRIGRGIRYGNENDRVNVHYFFMQGTFDELSYNIVARKRGWNEAIWDKEAQNEIDTIAEMTGGMPSEEEIALALTEDPVERRMLELEIKRKHLQNDLFAANDGVKRARGRLENHKLQKVRTEKSLEESLKKREKLKEELKNAKDKEASEGMVKYLQEQRKTNESRIVANRRFLEDYATRLSSLERQLEHAERVLRETEADVNIFVEKYIPGGSTSLNGELIYGEVKIPGDELEKIRKEHGIGEEVPPDAVSSTQFNIPEEQKSKFTEYVDKIPDNDLYVVDDKYGRETEPHVTVLYGLETGNAEDVKNVVENYGEVSFELGEISVFENPDFDVVVVDVVGDDLKLLNDELRSKLEYTSDFEDYKPHITLAYVKKGKGAKYEGDKTFAGDKFTLSELLFSDKAEVKTPIRLAEDGKGRRGEGEKKRFVDEETYRKAKNELSDPDNFQLGAGVDPVKAAKTLKNLTIVGAYHFENGVRKFEDWSSRMISEFGDKVKKYLNEIWENIHKDYASYLGSPFYYKSERVIFEKMPESATPEQVRGILKDVPVEELEWLGIEEFLKEKENSQKGKYKNVLGGAKNVLKAQTDKILENILMDEEAYGALDYLTKEKKIGEFLEWVENYNDGIIPFVVFSDGTITELKLIRHDKIDDGYVDVILPSGEEILIPEQYIYNAIKSLETQIKEWRVFREGNELKIFDKNVKKGIAKFKDRLKGKVSKSELLEFVRENNVMIEEVEKTDEKPFEEQLKANNLKLEVNGEETEYQRDGQIYYDLIDKNNNHTLVTANKEELKNYINSDPRFQHQDEITKFSQYQEPGGENYKELLLTLPETPPQQLKDLKQLPFEEYSKKYPTKVEIFKSSHFEEPNIVAHVRFNDRTDASGNKILFLEEIQSDWHQKGRERGYKGEKDHVYFKIKDEFAKKYNLPGIEISDILVTGDLARMINNKNINLFEKEFAEKLKEKYGLEELKKAYSYGNNIENLIPNAPFKKTWHELATKRMLRYAAENGYDGIAWTTPAMQVNRWESAIRQEVDTIHWQKYKSTRAIRNKDVYRVSEGGEVLGREFETEEAALDFINDEYGNEAIDSGRFEVLKDEGSVLQAGEHVIINGIKSGENRFKHTVPVEGTTYIQGQEVTLDNLLGKEMANQIRQSKDRAGKFAGESIIIGGEQFRVLYGIQIPSFLNKYAKKWGARVGEIEIETITKPVYEVEEETGNVIDVLSGNERVKSKVPYLPITESMKQRLRGTGQPLFGSSVKRLVPDETYKLAQENIVRKLGQLNAGFDPTLIKDYLVIGTYHVENLIRRGIKPERVRRLFKENMVKDFGRGIRSRLNELWKNIWRAFGGHLAKIVSKNPFFKSYMTAVEGGLFDDQGFIRDEFRKEGREPKRKFEPSRDEIDIAAQIERAVYTGDGRSRLDRVIDEYEKQLETGKDVKVTKYTSTLIKQKIKDLERGYKLGAIDKQKELQAIKQMIGTYARKNMPNDKYKKADITKILTRIIKAKNPKTVLEAYNKIDEIIDTRNDDKIREKIEDILKRYKPVERSGRDQGTNLTAEDYKYLNMIREVMELNEDQVQQRTEEIVSRANAYRDDLGQELSEEDVKEMYILGTFGNYASLSGEKLNTAYNFLRDIIAEGRVKYWTLESHRKALMDDLAGEVVRAVTGGQGLRSSFAEQKQKLVKGKRKKYSFDKYDTHMLSFEWHLEKLFQYDLESVPLKSDIQKYFMPKIQEATNKETAGVRKYRELFVEKLEEIYGKKGKSLAKELKDNAEIKETGIEFINAEGSTEEVVLSQNQAAKKWMEYQDPSLWSTFDRWGYTEEVMNEIEQWLKPEVKRWAEWQLYEFYPKYYDEVNAVYRERFFVDLPYNPFYSPIFRDFKGGEATADLLEDANIYATVMPGSLKKRIENTQELRLVDNDVVLSQHLVKMEHFKAWAEVIRELRSVFNRRDVRKAIRQYHNSSDVDVLTKMIDDLARGGVDKAMSIGLIDKIRSNFTMAVLAGNLTVVPKQWASAPGYIAEIPAHQWVKGFVDVIAQEMKYRTSKVVPQSIRKQIFGDPKSPVKFLLENSEMLKARIESGHTRDVKLLLRGQNVADSLAGVRSLAQRMMITVRIGDIGAIVNGGWAVYKYHYEKSINDEKSPARAHEDAMMEFELSTARMQQSGQTQDLSDIQRQGSWAKLFTMFITAQNQYYRGMSGALRNLVRGRGTKKDNLKRIAVAHFILPSLFQYAASGFPGLFSDWDDRDTKRQIRALALGSLNGLLVVGDILEGMVDALLGDTMYVHDQLPVGSSFKYVGNALKEINKMLDDGELTVEEIISISDHLLRGASKFLGIPYDPLRSVGRGVLKAIEGELDSVMELFGYSEFALGQENMSKEIKDIRRQERKVKDLKERYLKSQKYTDKVKFENEKTRLDQMRERSKDYQKLKEDAAKKRKETNELLNSPGAPKIKWK